LGKWFSLAVYNALLDQGYLWDGLYRDVPPINWYSGFWCYMWLPFVYIPRVVGIGPTPLECVCGFLLIHPKPSAFCSTVGMSTTHTGWCSTCTYQPKP
jgi:hypothetical protein